MVVAKNPGERGKWALSLLGPEAAVQLVTKILTYVIRKADTRRRYRVRGDGDVLSVIVRAVSFFPSQILYCALLSKRLLSYMATRVTVQEEAKDRDKDQGNCSNPTPTSSRSQRRSESTAQAQHCERGTSVL
jgi:hypothetical protein